MLAVHRIQSWRYRSKGSVNVQNSKWGKKIVGGMASGLNSWETAHLLGSSHTTLEFTPNRVKTKKHPVSGGSAGQEHLVDERG